MKKSIILLSALLMLSGVASAQDDDMYYTPGKKSNKVQDKQELKIQNGSDAQQGETPAVGYSGDAVRDRGTASRRYLPRDYSDAEIDAYNRRSNVSDSDTLYLGDGEKGYSSRRKADADKYDEYADDDYYYSGRLARFHEPAVNIYLGFGVPYWGWSYGFYDWDPWYDPYWGWSYGWNWYPRYYDWYWGWNWPYYSHWYGGWGWYDWHGPYWDRGPRYYSGWNGGRWMGDDVHYSRIGSAGGRITGGGRNYRALNEANGIGGSSRSYSSSSRGINSRYSVGGVPSGRTRYDSSKMDTRVRSYGNSESTISRSMSTRSIGGQSGSYGSSRSMGGSIGSPSMGTRSFGGGGGGRSFGGGGGGRSFGGGGGRR